MIHESVKIEEACIIRPGVKIGEGSTIKCAAILGTGVQLGDRCYVGPGAMLLHMSPSGVSNPAVLEDDVFVGGGAIILPGAVLKSGVIVGAGSVVTKGVYDKGTYVGNPARALK